LRSAQRIAAPRVIAKAQHQGARERTIILDEIAARFVVRGVHHLPEADGHVLFVEALGLEHREKAIQPTDETR
jgi:hypothetical protein